jgi:NADPH:quinone reductase-like Zn-dependent oxidoreductase
MKAVVYDTYGPPEVLHVAEVPKPVPKDDEVLIKIHATTFNRTASGFRDPEPFFIRVWSGLVRPKIPILGSELAGVVEAVGKDVRSFRVGDEVFGLTGRHFGAHAEYVCLPESGPIALKPTNMTFEEAAAVCDGAMLAMSCLRKGELRRGQSLLVYGASGAIGTAAVQIAKSIGADVTAVCNGKNVELVRSLGADRVIDYETEDFTKADRTYDVIFDAVGKTSFFRCRHMLRRGGVYLETDLGFLWQNPMLALVTSLVGPKRVMIPMPDESKAIILALKQMIEAGEYRAVIDRRYPLEEIVEAARYVDTGQKTGNVVVTVAD